MTAAQVSRRAPNLLVVDDTPANLHLITSILKECGFKVRPVPSGELALRAVQASPPDLILLDINMPGLNGYQVCERLKADPATAGIPVMFISALNETFDKVKAFRSGGVDYVTKPFQLEEVEARVRTQLDLLRQRRDLEQSLVKQREAEELRDGLVHMMVHDMRSPLLAMQLSMDVLSEYPFGGRGNDMQEMVQTCRRSTGQLIEMVNQLLDVSRLEAGALTPDLRPADLRKIVDEAVETCRYLSPGKTIRVVGNASHPLVCDAALIQRVVVNLLSNALKFTRASGNVTIRLEARGERQRVEVIDNGPGIAPENHARIFEKFGQVEGAKAKLGSGLGLTFVKLAVAAHGGEVGLSSALGEGSVFWIELPNA